MIVLFLAVGFLVSHTDADVRFANYYGDGMVLEGAPAEANIWGYGGAEGDNVTVLLDGEEVAMATVGNDSKWSARLPAMDFGGPHTINITSGDSTASLVDVMFGSVWICSGQSNMEMEFLKMQNFSTDMERVIPMSNIRMLRIKKTTATTIQEEPEIATAWQKPANDSTTEWFSGLCLLYAMELSAHIDDRPIGMIASSWGGTPVESWSDASIIDSCPGDFDYGEEPEHADSQLWNAMIAPLTGMTIKGAIWYQGESNGAHPAEYKCSFKAMIDDWRKQFNAASGTDAEFPFGFVQLASWRDEHLPAGFIDIRWSQTYEYGYVPNPGMKNVFMAVAHDLPDFDSPYGGIHPRDKEDIAVRLVLAARAVAYGEDVDFQGPFPTSFTLTDSSLTIEYDDDLLVKNNGGFEVCCKENVTDYCWPDEFSDAPMAEHTTSTVTIDTSACDGQEVAAVRYAWEETPCDFKDCPIYEVDNDLPAPCFKKSGPF